MESWLDADKTLILDQALKHYRLAWHEVIAHAFLPRPNRPCKSARVPGGPWRCSKYEIENIRRYTLNITLTNGPTRKIPVSGVPTHDTVDEPPHEETLDINLDTAGFSHTLRILEGIAAEGKPWFDREPGTPPPPEPDPPSGPMGPVVLPTGAGEPSLH